jgi:hypothetical protein
VKYENVYKILEEHVAFIFVLSSTQKMEVAYSSKKLVNTSQITQYRIPKVGNIPERFNVSGSLTVKK